MQKVSASQLIAGVRDPEKAHALAAKGVTVRKLDYNEPASVEAALAGVERVLLISSSEVAKSRAAQHSVVLDAAKKAGVKLLAYTSVLHGDQSKILLAHDHQATEQALKASGVPYVLLRNGWYTENYLGNLGPVLQSGVMIGAAGEGRVAVASRVDFAEAAAVVISTSGHEGKTYELAGDTAHTMAEIAAEIARASGKPVRYQNLSAGDYSATLEKFGVPAGFAGILADSDVGIERGDLNDASGDLRKLIGRPTTPISVTIAAALK